MEQKGPDAHDKGIESQIVLFGNAPQSAGSSDIQTIPGFSLLERHLASLDQAINNQRSRRRESL